MTSQEASPRNAMRLRERPPQGFDPFAATNTELRRHGLPLRPDPDADPHMAALWERKARRYRNFEHLEPQFQPAPASRTAAIPDAAPSGSFYLSPYQSCGYELDSSAAAPFTALSLTWTVPDLTFNPNPPVGPDPNLFHTFVTLTSVQGGPDVHVNMSVDSANTVTCQLWAEFVGDINLPVRPGDVLHGSICFDTKPPGRVNYFFANETTGQTMSFVMDSNLPPATAALVGVSRDGNFQQPPLPALPQFGAVYFDEISAYTTGGWQSLTSGIAVSMSDVNGNTIAKPDRLTDWTFKVL